MKPSTRPIDALIPQDWDPSLRVLVWVVLWIFLGLVALTYLAGVLIVGEEIWVAIHSDGEERFGAARLSMLVFVGLLGAPFVLWRALLQSRQVAINQESHYTELFTKAVEQLGATKTVWKKAHSRPNDAQAAHYQQMTVPNIEVRIGAIYSLEQLMRVDPKRSERILDLLANYIKQNCREPVELTADELPEEEECRNWNSWRMSLRKAWRRKFEVPTSSQVPDIMACLSVISKRSHDGLAATDKKIDLRGVCLQGLDLSDLNFCYCDLTGARFEVARVVGAVFSGSVLNEARFVGCDIKQVQFEHARLQYTDFTGVTANSSTGFIGASLFSACFRGSVLPGVDFSKVSTLMNSDFQGARLALAKFRGTWLQMVEFPESSVAEADFRGCRLDNVSFHSAMMRKVAFEGAHFENVELSGALLAGDYSYMAATQYDGFLVELSNAFAIKSQVKLPEGVEPPEHWPDTGVGLEVNEAWSAFKKGGWLL